MLDFLHSRQTLGLTALLLAEVVAFYAYPKNEYVPLARPLSSVPREFKDWRMVAEFPMQSEVQEVLKADDTMNRNYASPTGESANLYVAFFKTQRTGISPHSPKVCLPGSGWVPSESTSVKIPVAGLPEPITVNRYIVTRGDNKSVVLYWYQTPHRVIADEYAAKVYTVIDSVRYRRSDTSMVRVVVPVFNGDLSKAEATAVGFVQTVFQPLKGYLPA